MPSSIHPDFKQRLRKVRDAARASLATPTPDDGSFERQFADLPRLLDVKQVAELLGLTVKGVYSLVENRRIPSLRVSNRVRFSRSDVVAWLKENRVPASGE